MLLSYIIRKGNGSSILCLIEGTSSYLSSVILAKYTRIENVKASKEDARKSKNKKQKKEISTSYCLLLYVLLNNIVHVYHFCNKTLMRVMHAYFYNNYYDIYFFLLMMVCLLIFYTFAVSSILHKVMT